MDILIKGMEMPKDSKLLGVLIHPDGKVNYSFDWLYLRIATAVPVPPHGRLGDLDAVYQFAKDQLVKETGAFSKGVNKSLKDIMVAVKNSDAIPTIIPAEEGET